MRNDIYKIEESILDEVKLIAGNTFNYIHGYLAEANYQERIENASQDDDIPYILIRAGEIEHKQEGHKFVKSVKVLLQITTKKENVEVGYKDILQITNDVMEMLAEKSFKEKGYKINTDIPLKAIVNEYYTSGNYWSYDITFALNMYPAQTGELCKKLGM